MRLAIVTDAWAPQTNGVVTTISSTARNLTDMGHEVALITPEYFRTVPCPGYREIRLSVGCRRSVAGMLDAADPDTVHIATEGPLGMAARSWCLENDFPFVTSLHTRFPEYIRMRAPVPLALSYAWLRRFHAPAVQTMVRSETQRELLAARGFRHLDVWPGAVDTSLFRPRGKRALCLPRPISMYMGRVSIEKGLDDFLSLDLPGSKVVIGGGPDLARLQEDYPDAHFLGPRYGEELAGLLSSADVFVFPSRTDTLGLVMLEAMACGVPVAAYRVPGPQDVVRDGYTGALDDSLENAVFRAFRVNPQACVEFAEEHDWRRSTEYFLRAQQPRARERLSPAAG
ncbi:MAG: glycosyltransferase family 1 protein [Chromatiales bacterium]|jgi:glycosyltransferase involved in cell wall biosynthesis